jgi:hypothetical protein
MECMPNRNFAEDLLARTDITAKTPVYAIFMKLPITSP